MMYKYAFKVDAFSRARGGHSQFLDIFCSACQTKAVLYQKDGPGHLYRMYIDRIFEPEQIRETLGRITSKKEMTGLKCTTCGALLGIPMVYEKEQRLAFQIVKGSCYKKRSEHAK